MVMVFIPLVVGAKLSIKRPFFKFVSVSRIGNIEKIRAILAVIPILNHVLKTVQPSLKTFLKSITRACPYLDNVDKNRLNRPQNKANCADNMGILSNNFTTFCQI